MTRKVYVKDMMSLGDFEFLAFMTKAEKILKRLRDKRLTNNRYVSEYSIGSEDYAGKMWFHIPCNTKRSIPVESYVEDCNRLGCQWEIRQHADEKNYTVFLFVGGTKPWRYNKQVRTVRMQREERELYQ